MSFANYALNQNIWQLNIFMKRSSGGRALAGCTDYKWLNRTIPIQEKNNTEIQN